MAKVALYAGLETGVCRLSVVFTTPLWAADSMMVFFSFLQVLKQKQTDDCLHIYTKASLSLAVLCDSEHCLNDIYLKLFTRWYSKEKSMF